MKQLLLNIEYPVTQKSLIHDQISNASTSELLHMFNKIYHNQTDEEKYLGKTMHRNKKGFSKYDTRKADYYAFIIGGGGWLKLRHLENIRNLLMKYWRQLEVSA